MLYIINDLPLLGCRCLDRCRCQIKGASHRSQVSHWPTRCTSTEYWPDRNKQNQPGSHRSRWPVKEIQLLLLLIFCLHILRIDKQREWWLRKDTHDDVDHRTYKKSQILQLSSEREQSLKNQEEEIGGTCDAPRISQRYDQVTALGLKKIRVQEQRDQLVAGGKANTRSLVPGDLLNHSNGRSARTRTHKLPVHGPLGQPWDQATFSVPVSLRPTQLVLLILFLDFFEKSDFPYPQIHAQNQSLSPPLPNSFCQPE